MARLCELKNAVAKDPNHEHHQGLTEKIITAQGTIFFVAGFETTSNTLSTLCYRSGNFSSTVPTNYTGCLKWSCIWAQLFHWFLPAAKQVYTLALSSSSSSSSSDNECTFWSAVEILISFEPHGYLDIWTSWTFGHLGHLNIMYNWTSRAFEHHGHLDIKDIWTWIPHG